VARCFGDNEAESFIKSHTAQLPISFWTNCGGHGAVSEYKMAQASHLRLTLATARFELVAGWRDLPKPSRTVAQATILRSTANTIHHFCPPPSQLSA
jgi:hypothetical protein